MTFVHCGNANAPTVVPDLSGLKPWHLFTSWLSQAPGSFCTALLILGLLCAGCSRAEDSAFAFNSLALPEIGEHSLEIIAPTILQLTSITTKEPDPASPAKWNFVGKDFIPQLPETGKFAVTAGGKKVAVIQAGFKRRVVYAPLKKRDLRIGNWLYLKLERPIAENETVEVTTTDTTLWPSDWKWTCRFSRGRWSPVLHVNQVGYAPEQPKRAMVGFYLGSLGELNIPEALKPNPSGPRFRIVELRTNKKAFEGALVPRAESGWNFDCYNQVLEGDFSGLQATGEYVMEVEGLGRSFPFRIDPGVPACFARTYALGLYHQRCGTDNSLPYTRFTHEPCHTAWAEIPNLTFTNAQFFLAQSTADWTNTARHTAPRLENSSKSLYPFQREGKIDVSGGHHDAGDYSKYTINSAGLVHFLVFAADVFPGAGTLDNLGLPESGDGKSDVLQEAKWESDFLAKMQDLDGGFYFLVYPRNRRYENNVPPDKGDPQIVWPKNTASTAAAVAALAQCASSPLFKKQFPEAAVTYMEKAKKGWAFLEKASQEHGSDGSYQKLTHYGNEFRHDDEIAWAACELYLATGEAAYHHKLKEMLNPSKSKKWGWLRLYEAYGRAIRSYAFASKTGRVKAGDLDLRLLRQCEDEIIAAANDQLRRSKESAYSISFPSETKRTRSAGWFFASDCEFDLATAMQLDFPSLKDPRQQYMDALLGNLSYEAGCNPVNVSFITGLGWIRPQEIVHQWSQNSPRHLPPDGIPIGNIQGGFGWLDHYKRELGALSFPPDGGEREIYPFYDRWGDSFNLSTEFVVVNQARGLAVGAMLMGRSALRDQEWKGMSAKIQMANDKQTRKATLSPEGNGFPIDSAQVVWDVSSHPPAVGQQLRLLSTEPAPSWMEAEACLPDGRRIFGVLGNISQPGR
ncbi:MAG: hypothetical protein JWM16_2058 [Verrucomicrobiales bacterium]|nr:hypothetical protein [Verrucomicrobiales bacterium]